jgi:hypothetical protein
MVPRAGNGLKVGLWCALGLAGNALLHSPEGLVYFKLLGHSLKRR